MSLEFLVIANPASGQRRGPELARLAVEGLRAAGRTAELFLTEGPGGAGVRARHALDEGVATIVGCGGDGTLQELADAVAATPVRLGILPGGRCNDLARALGLHRKDPLEKLLAPLLSDAFRRIDVARYSPLDGRPPKRFCTVATLGFDTAVTEFVRAHRFPVRGSAEYVYGVLRVLLSFRPPVVRLTGDFGTFEGPITLAATANSAYYGGAMRIAPDARVDDGQLDLCVVDALPRETIVRVLPLVFSGRHTEHSSVRMLRTRKVEIEVLEGSPNLCADGEILGSAPAYLECEAGALKVCSEFSTSETT